MAVDKEEVRKLVIPAENGANNLSFCSAEDARNIVAVGGPTNIGIKSLQFNVDETEGGVASWLDVLKLKHVLDVVYHNVSLVTWSPATSHSHAQYRFSACSRDSGAVAVFSSTLEETTCEFLQGHRSAVNDLSAHPHEAELVATVGDDCTCRIWDLQQSQLRSEYKLGSPGKRVCWHPLDQEKLLVGERSGRVRMYDSSTDTPIMSLDCPRQPLLDVDWAPSNSQLVGGVAGDCWYMWDLSYSSQPVECKSDHRTVPMKFRWSSQSDKVFATLSTSSEVKVHHLAHKKVPFSSPLKLASDLAWHKDLPLLIAACNRSLCCWQLEL